VTPLGRRRQEESGLFATERPPRLVLRFAIVLSLALAVASALIIIVVHRFAISQAEHAATRQASIIASTVLQRQVRPGDLARPVSPSRRRELDALFRSQLLASDTVGVALVRADGLLTYATDHRDIGTIASGDLASEAASGTIVSHVSTGSGAASKETRTLETYAPVGVGSYDGAALIIQAYAPIQDAASEARLRVGGVLEGLLFGLFLVFVPLLSRVTTRIKRQIDKIHAQAFYDELTGLPNRAHLFERLRLALDRALRENRRLAVLLVDLDRFREINDTLGHEAGDTLLRATAERLSASVGPKTLLARLGGDEFAMVIECTDEPEVEAFGGRIRLAIEPPLLVGDVPLAVEGTVGIAFFPKDGRDAETLLKHAEVATYAAKESRIGVLVYNPTLDAHDPEQLKLVAELRNASDRGELSLHYQPKVDLATGAVVGFEALVYWQHPDRGLLPPGAFVPIAERTGGIRHLSRTVLTRAIAQLRDWESLDPELTISVNLTAIDLLDLELPEQLEALLREHGVDSRRLWIELTESTVMADPKRAQSVLDRIVSTGVRVSIDDFGTGHSSLAYLKHLPVHEVKIDRSFVTGMTLSPHDRLIVEATIQLGHNFGLGVVAEGVETLEIHDALRTLGCDRAQGYLYARPQPVEAVTAKLPGWTVEPGSLGLTASGSDSEDRRPRRSGARRRSTVGAGKSPGR
jgi:diguanylate cyclase (GGDEF)-like protein